MPRPSELKPGKKEIAKIYHGLKAAGFDGYKIVSLHLAPGPRSAGSAATDPSDLCHAQELPNGHWVIVCD